MQVSQFRVCKGQFLNINNCFNQSDCLLYNNSNSSNYYNYILQFYTTFRILK